MLLLHKIIAFLLLEDIRNLSLFHCFSSYPALALEAREARGGRSKSINVLTWLGCSFMMRLRHPIHFEEGTLGKRLRNLYFVIEMVLFSICIILFTTGNTKYAFILLLLFLLIALIAGIISVLFMINFFLALLFPFSYLSLLLRLFPQSISFRNYRAYAYLRRKRYEKALEDCNYAIQAGSKLGATYAYRGQAYYNCKEYQKAIEDYTIALGLKPRDARYYNNRGWAYVSLKEYQKAIQDFDQALVYSRRLPQAYIGKGVVYGFLKENIRSIQSFERAISLSKTKQQQASAYRARALLYLQMGEYQQVIQDCYHVLAEMPSDPQAYSYCAYAHLRLQEYLPAVQACNQAIRIAPGSALAYNIRAVVFLALSNLQQARADLERAWEIEPRNAAYNWFREWARLCEPQEMPDEKIADHLIELAELYPENQKTIHFARGFAHWVKGSYSEALTEFELSLQLDTDPTQWDTHFWKGITLASLGRDQEAREAISTSLDQDIPIMLLSPLRRVRLALYQEFVLAKK